MALNPEQNGISIQRETRKNLVSRQRQDKNASRLVALLTLLPILFLVVLVAALAIRSAPILADIPLFDLLTGKVWRPSQGLFGFLPFIAGSLWVTIVAMVFAVPVSLFTAIYLTDYARSVTRTIRIGAGSSIIVSCITNNRIASSLSNFKFSRKLIRVSLISRCNFLGY